MEEKRQKMIALENQRNLAGIGNPETQNNQDNIAATVNANMQQLNILQHLNANLNPALPPIPADPPAPVPNPHPIPMEVDENNNENAA